MNLTHIYICFDSSTDRKAYADHPHCLVVLLLLKVLLLRGELIVSGDPLSA